MKVSIFTPTNDVTWLKDVYESLKEQTYEDWEWVLVQNGGAVVPDFGDKRIKIFPFEYGQGKIGALKNFACKNSIGDIYLELDHDDLLTPDCLEKVVKVFKDDPEVTMVFSNFAQVDMKMKTANIWSKYYGWEYRPFKYKDHDLLEVVSPLPIPQNLSRIWFAPNHVRAWRANSYWEMGGHDISMNISDDHDLVSRNYIHGKIHWIDECLYIYRLHTDNYTFQRNAEIQTTMWDNYDKYIWDLAGKWADTEGLRKIDLCGAIKPFRDYETYDRHNATIVGDLDKKWKLEDNSVGVLRAEDAVEHMKDPIHTMNEAWRVLKHGGFFMINVPNTDGRGAFQDPTHKSYWNANSIWYYTRKDMHKFIEPECKAKFQVVRVRDWQPNDGCKEHNIWYTEAHLIAVKDGKRFHGKYDF